MKAEKVKERVEELQQQRKELQEQIEPLRDQFKTELAKEAMNESNTAGELRPELEKLKTQAGEIDLLLPVLEDRLTKQQAEEQEAQAKELLQEAGKIEKQLKEEELPQLANKLQELQQYLNSLESKQKEWRSLRINAGESPHKEPPGPVKLQKELQGLLNIYTRRKASRAG